MLSLLCSLALQPIVFSYHDIVLSRDGIVSSQASHCTWFTWSGSSDTASHSCCDSQRPGHLGLKAEGNADFSPEESLNPSAATPATTELNDSESSPGCIRSLKTYRGFEESFPLLDGIQRFTIYVTVRSKAGGL